MHAVYFKFESICVCVKELLEWECVSVCLIKPSTWMNKWVGECWITGKCDDGKLSCDVSHIIPVQTVHTVICSDDCYLNTLKTYGIQMPSHTPTVLESL